MFGHVFVRVRGCTVGEPLYGEPISYNNAEEDPSFQGMLMPSSLEPSGSHDHSQFSLDRGYNYNRGQSDYQARNMSPLVTVHLQVPQKIGKTWSWEPQGG